MNNNLLYSNDKIDMGLLLLRIGIGLAFMVHGFPKVFLGGAMGLAKGMAAAGIPGGVLAAYLAGAAEFFGGMALIAGIVFRPASVFLAITMLVAMLFHINKGDKFVQYSHAMESAILFISLIFTGPGKYSLDKVWFGEKHQVAATRTADAG